MLVMQCSLAVLLIAEHVNINIKLMTLIFTISVFNILYYIFLLYKLSVLVFTHTAYIKYDIYFQCPNSKVKM